MELDAESVARGRQRLIETFGSARGLLAWTLLTLAETGQPADVTYYQRKPSLNVTIDAKLACVLLYGGGAKALQNALQRIALSDGTEVAFAEIWTVNPMPVGGLSEAALAAADISEGNLVIAENGATMRQVIRETHHCTAPAEEEFYLRRFAALELLRTLLHELEQEEKLSLGYASACWSCGCARIVKSRRCEDG
jgi:hypothetical protein